MNIKYLIILPVVIMFLFVACGSTSQKEKSTIFAKKEINSKEALKLIGQDTTMVVLDVRTPSEYQIGHIKGAINMNVTNSNFVKEIEKLDKTKTYLVYCRTHNRSNLAVKRMQKRGFENIYQMMDGFAGWNRNNLPIGK